MRDWTAQRPEKTIEAVRAFDGPIVLDLDETLYLRNSTEDFIDSVRPGLLVLVVLRALDAIKPWRWTGGEVTRDVWRVRLVRLLFPWAERCWLARVARCAASYTNSQLSSILRERGVDPIVLTVGFHPIVAPLLAAMGFARAQLVASRLSATDRLSGKLAMAREALGDALIKRSLVVTDSRDDIPLLEMCALPCLTLWPEARYVPAMSGVYLPGQYLSRVKRPGQRYILRGILLEDFAFWVLASILLARSPPIHLLGLLALLVSFWSIYEKGYVDNDLLAARFESDPKLSAAFGVVQVATPAVTPWIWAATAGAAGVWLLRYPALPAPADAAKWAGVLVVTHAVFWIYNRLDKTTRVWPFAGLQLARAASFATIVPVTLAGALALGALALARWVPYYAYRYGKAEWVDGPLGLSRMLIFGISCVTVAGALGPSVLMEWSFPLLVTWSLYRARKDLRLVLGSATRLDRSVLNRPPPPSGG